MVMPSGHWVHRGGHWGLGTQSTSGSRGGPFLHHANHFPMWLGEKLFPTNPSATAAAVGRAFEEAGMEMGKDIWKVRIERDHVGWCRGPTMPNSEGFWRVGLF